MSTLLERYKNLVKTGFEYAAPDKGSAPTSTFEIYMGHFHDIGCDVEEEITRLRQLLSEAEKREKEARAKALEEAAKVAEDEDGHFTIWGEDRNTRTSQKTARDIAAAILALQSKER